METQSSYLKVRPKFYLFELAFPLAFPLVFALLSGAFLNGAFPAAARAQTPSEPLKILAARNVVILEPGRERPARAGVVLKTEYNLRISDEGYVALLHHKGKAFELREAGVYAAKDLDSKYSAASAPKSSTHKLAAFVLQSVAAESEAASHRQSMRAVGAVARMSSGSGEPVVLSPRDGAIADTVVVFRWYAPDAQAQTGGGAFATPLARPLRSAPTDSATDNVSRGSSGNDPAPTFRLEIHALNGATLYAVETQDSTHAVNLRSAGVKQGDTFCWTVAQKTARAEGQKQTLAEYRALLLSEAEASEIRGVVTALREEFASAAPRSPLPHFLAGGVLERNRCYAEALKEYAQAVAYAPDVNDYVEAFNALAAKLGMSEEEAARLLPARASESRESRKP
jgi:hypothetical protein